jgi:hypothetical protein
MIHISPTHAAVALLLALSAGAQAQPAAAAEAPASAASTYTLRKNPTLLGFTFDTVLGNATSRLPFDKPYADLTSEQKERVRSLYKEMGETDEPPYPIDGLGSLLDPIAQGGQALQVQGDYVGVLTVGADGTPISIHAVKWPNNKTARFIARVALLTKFKAALCNGTLCEMPYLISVHFKLE